MANKKAGGNTSSSGSPYQMLKGNARSPDTQALAGAALAGGYGDDTEYGLSNFGATPEGPNSDKGVYRWETVSVGSPRVPNRSRPSRKQRMPWA